MPQMANIVLADAQATPVDHTFKPMSLKGDIGLYNDDAVGTVQSWPSITISTRPATTSNSGHKTVLRLTYPHAVMDESGVCCTPRGTPLPYSQFQVEFIRSNAATAADFATVLKYLQQVVLDPQFTKTASGESLR